MPDMTTTQADTVPSEEEGRRVWADLPDTDGKPPNGEILDLEQDSHDVPLPDKHTLFLSFIAACDSMEEASEDVCSDYPELAAWTAYRFLLNSLTSTADGVDERLAPDQEECDRFAAQHTSLNRSIKQDAGMLDRMFESACHAHGICGAKMGMEPFKNIEKIKKLKARHKPYDQCLPGLGI